MRRNVIGVGLALLLTALVGHAAAPHPGKLIYDRACSACHDNAVATRSPPVETLKGMRYQTIFYALTEGKMKPQADAARLTKDERTAVIDFLVGRAVVNDAWVGRMACTPARAKVDPAAPPLVAGFGFDDRNTRHLTAAQAGIATADFAQLELAWAIAIPGTTTMRAQSAVAGTTLFFPATDAARLLALDIAGNGASEGPCVKWAYENSIPLRTGVAYGELPGKARRKVVAFSDVAMNVHVLDAVTGKQLWQRQVGLSSYSNTTGTPVFHGNRLYVPLSATEINYGGNDDHECCKSHGGVVALDATTGKRIWTYHTMPEAKPVRDRGDGKFIWGPSGAPIWNSPVVDAKRGVLYVGTGEATSAPAWQTTDAILAIDLRTGKLRWHFQATESDIFLTGCMNRRDGLNCPREGEFRDVDFGASVILARRPDGRDLILAGQKSGTVWALDPDAGGALLWRRDFGTGSPIGGIHWGIAFDGARVFAPINSMPDANGRDPNQTPGVHAVNVADGSVLWSYESRGDCSGDRLTRVPSCAAWVGMTGAPTVVDGALVQGSADGWLRAFDATTGTVLWQFDTARPYQGVNGEPGHGGAIDNASIIAANGYLFVNSGYGLIGRQRVGNVFLAFRKRQGTGP